jgi:hypothetical protein
LSPLQTGARAAPTLPAVISPRSAADPQAAWRVAASRGEAAAVASAAAGGVPPDPSVEWLSGIAVSASRGDDSAVAALRLLAARSPAAARAAHPGAGDDAALELACAALRHGTGWTGTTEPPLRGPPWSGVSYLSAVLAPYAAHVAADAAASARVA